MSDWTTPEDIAAQVRTLWDRGRILSASLTGTSLFPLPVRARRPDAAAITTNFDGVRQWIAMLEEGSKANRGFGYDILWTETRHRLRGRNRIPKAIQVESERDALRLIGKERDADRFQRMATATATRFPSLRSWLADSPLIVLDNATDWERILAVLTWFRDHPQPGLYLRQLDIPGVDSKFIEERRPLFASLLDQVMPADAIAREFVGTKNFEQRYGLLFKPAAVRFRVLDSSLRIRGISDITARASEFARLDIPVRNVFITENEISGLAFPDVAESLVILGLGYGVALLADCEWIAKKDVFYWGDLDTHGFAMLDQVRAFLPHARSLLMDRETLLAHRPLWVTEPHPHDKPLMRLTQAEGALYKDLRTDQLGTRVRLEQERISTESLRNALSSAIEVIRPTI
ncbi:DUF3322 and DUF2220 domain-containing protein [soil metagenome]